MNISLATAELLEEPVVSMGLCVNAGQPDDVPVVFGNADDEDDDEDDDDLDHDWEEVGDEEEDDEDEEEDDEE